MKASCTAWTTIPGGDPHVPGSCYSPPLAAGVFAVVLVVLLLVAAASWLARRSDKPRDVPGIEYVYDRELGAIRPR